MKVNIFKPAVIVLFTLAVLMDLPAKAQHTFSNSISQFYRDGYLWNPSLAGNNGKRFYGLLNNSWIGFDGSDKLIGFAGDIKVGDNMGAGIRLSSNTSGILQRYLAAFSYAFEIKMKNDASLRIGEDLSLYKEHLDSKSLIYDGQVDPEAASYSNHSGLKVNGDIGLSYNIKAFTLGATAYNVGAYLQSSDKRGTDMEIGEVATSYNFQFTDSKLSLTPLAAYEMYYSNDNIFTLASQLEYDHVFHVSAYWQSTGNIMGGVGLMLKNFGEVNFFYSTKNKYGYHEQYEVGLKYHID